MPSSTESDVRRIEEEFWIKCNIPNCVGAIDGKHVRIRAPEKSESLFFNYKFFFSIVLLPIVDANCKFISDDVGAYGKESDNGIFHKSAMGKKIATKEFNIPPSKCLPGSDVILPPFLIGDEAFALSDCLMKPYSTRVAASHRDKQIYNYRLCRARRVSENVFGLLSQVFKVFYCPIVVAPEVDDDLVLSACCLHNLLRDGYLEENGIPFYSYSFNEATSQNNMQAFLVLEDF
ncbi:putative nuclease HARBI1 [Schistocerca serialis cubense]|uniref:putative nuclease HARBI1 n=1 Tax=Schistocerca serialis cubense TaxID=2023355 RepID=UPI00214E1B22|nr:putative nuclease HARBI1 [Schistocerca serialis cubense]